MMARIFAAAVLAIACSAATARAQERWGEERHEPMHWLRQACEAGDDRACWRLHELRHAWREREEGREGREGREHEHGWDNRQDWRQDRF
jgi:hypothetical protein